HPEITNVLLTGGEPLLLSTHKLERLISALREIEHVGIIRIGTKIPVFNPYRILEDPSLPEMISKYSRPDKRIYIVVQINHPREITDVAIQGIAQLFNAGAVLVNQTPLIRGINDDPDVLAELFRKLSFIGVSPYYVFQCRPTLGNKPYAVPLVEGYKIFEKAKTKVSGLAKRARYSMSHSSGKIEILGIDTEYIYLRYHRAAQPKNRSRFVIAERDDTAYWFDDLKLLTPGLALSRV
ncbi:KamA family radical SAM protein, partial [Candidatus Sumerlaeota bacterium]|nr:KamA family radical SAM protein [Candidatus Sumerlaeota bacterium]